MAKYLKEVSPKSISIPMARIRAYQWLFSNRKDRIVKQAVNFKFTFSYRTRAGEVPVGKQPKLTNA